MFGMTQVTEDPDGAPCAATYLLPGLVGPVQTPSSASVPPANASSQDYLAMKLPNFPHVSMLLPPFAFIRASGSRARASTQPGV